MPTDSSTTVITSSAAPAEVTHPPRVDRLFVGILAATLGFTLTVLLGAAVAGELPVWGALLVMLPTAAVVAATLPIRYTFLGDAFEARQGKLMKLRAPYDRIRTVRRKRHVWNDGETISLAREVVEIEYEAGQAKRWKKRLRVAPKDEAAFVAELLRRAPPVELEGFDEAEVDAARAALPPPPEPPVQLPTRQPQPEPAPFTRAARRHRS
jgi:hypothetical protein